MSERTILGEADWRLWQSLSAMTSQLGLELDRQLRSEAGLSQAEYDVVSTLSRARTGRMRAGELGELLAWEKSRVSHQLARMERRGLVVRESCDADGRGTWVSLSDEGRGLVDAASRIHAAALQEFFFDVLPDTERERLQEAATRVLDRLSPAACEIAEASGMLSRDEPAAVR